MFATFYASGKMCGVKQQKDYMKNYDIVSKTRQTRTGQKN